MTTTTASRNSTPPASSKAPTAPKARTGDRFDFPYGIALDAAGNVYVADDINHRIVKLNPQLGTSPNGAASAPSQASSRSRARLASDPAGDTYVADTANDRVEVFDPEGRFLRTIGTSARAPGPLTAPRGLAIDPTGRLFVSDTVDTRVEEFAPGTDAFAGSLDRSRRHTSGFNRPAGIAVDPRGAVYIADPADGRIVRFWGDGTYLSELGGPADVGGAGLSEAGSVAVAAALGRPVRGRHRPQPDPRLLAHGRLLARCRRERRRRLLGLRRRRIRPPRGGRRRRRGRHVRRRHRQQPHRRALPLGAVLAQWGSRGTGDGRFHSPTGIALDAAGNVYVVDSENNRVEVFDSRRHFLEKWGERGIGPGEFSSRRRSPSTATADVYVADTNNNRVERFDPVSPFGSGCLRPALWPPPLDVAPVLHVSLPRVHRRARARRARR